MKNAYVMASNMTILGKPNTGFFFLNYYYGPNVHTDKKAINISVLNQYINKKKQLGVGNEPYLPQQ